MKRRLTIARALVNQPEVLLLDEPTTGLDPLSRQQMWDVVRDLTADGVTVLLTTQYLEEAEQLADRVAVVDHGSVVAEGTVDELKQHVAAQRLDLTFADSDDVDAALAVLTTTLPRETVHHERGTCLVGVPTDASGADISDVLGTLARRGVAVQRVAVRSSSLDDVFFALTANQGALR
jgi:ABC-2 type transport system ATP-binding protein